MSSTAIVVDHLRGGLRCGEPQRSGPLTLVPLFHSGAAASYRLFAEALAAGRVTVEEVGAGSVPELALVNRGGEAVLVIEGEVLSGLRQTRIVNASVLVPPRTRLNLPVSCVELGRWRDTTERFGVGELLEFGINQVEGGVPFVGYRLDGGAVLLRLARIV